MKCIGGSVRVKTHKGWQKRKLWVASSTAYDKYWLVYVIVNGKSESLCKDGTLSGVWGRWRHITWPDTHVSFDEGGMNVWCKDLVIAAKQRLGVNDGLKGI